MTATTEIIILSSLVKQPEYCDAVLPFLKTEYFLDNSEKSVFETILAYYNKYHCMPTHTALIYEIGRAHV